LAYAVDGPSLVGRDLCRVLALRAGVQIWT